MKQVYLIHEGHPRLLLFFVGWAADATPFCHYRPCGMDYAVVYDYRDLRLDLGFLSNYREVHVLSWSMGVWAAGQVLLGMDARQLSRIATTTAFAGSQHPIDDREGIPRSIFQATLQGLTPASLQKFLRRMCGSSAAYRAFMAVTPRRDFSEVQEELRQIEQFVEASGMPHHRLNDRGFTPDLSPTDAVSAPHMALEGSQGDGEPLTNERSVGRLWRYDRAYIGAADHIFPAANLQAHYRALGCREVQVVDCAHYDDPLFRYLLQERWTDSMSNEQ